MNGIFSIVLNLFVAAKALLNLFNFCHKMPASIQITPKELSDSKDMIVVDIRPKEDYENWHIRGSMNIDIYNDVLSENLHAAAQKLLQIKTNKQIVAVCNAGVTAKIASQMLQSQGKNSSYLEGGMMGWSRFHKLFTAVENGDMIIKQIARLGKGCLSYLIASKSRKECIVVDPSHFFEEYTSMAKEAGFKIKGIVETHVHADHISGAKQLASIVNCEFYTPNENRAFTKIKDGDEISIGNLRLRVIGTPGHTDESICLIINDKAILTGDTLLLEGVGQPDLGGKEGLKNNAEMLHSSIGKIAGMDSNLVVLPAHFQDAESFPVAKRLAEIMSRDLFKKPKEEFINSITSNLQDTPQNYIQIKNLNRNFSNPPRMMAEQLEFGPNGYAAK